MKNALEKIFNNVQVEGHEGKISKPENFIHWMVEFEKCNSGYDYVQIYFEQNEGEDTDFIVIKIKKLPVIEEEEDLLKRVYVEIDYDNISKTIEEINNELKKLNCAEEID